LKAQELARSYPADSSIENQVSKRHRIKSSPHHAAIGFHTLYSNITIWNKDSRLGFLLVYYQEENFNFSIN
jgi:hypothetical protein